VSADKSKRLAGRTSSNHSRINANGLAAFRLFSGPERVLATLQHQWNVANYTIPAKLAHL
jgi:hypothetical protein